MSKALRLAVFGDPVEHSQSPRLHRLFAEECGVEVDYRRIRCNTRELPRRFERFVSDGGVGANLTVPLKQAGRRLCRQLDPAARLARAVNTLSKTAEGWNGFNTDGDGLLLDWARLGIDPSGQRILIIGAGGATAGLLGPLLARGPANVCILNRTLERATELSERFDHLGPIQAASTAHGPDPARPFDLIVQATSAGHDGALPPIETEWLTPNGRVYDLNYGPAHQPLRQWCRGHRIDCHSGLGMLVGQAALAFEIWTGQRPDLGRALARLSEQAADSI
jgi:shikimate dehydrogenase